jgi:hypothetical protein
VTVLRYGLVVEESVVSVGYFVSVVGEYHLLHGRLVVNMVGASIFL